MSFDFNLPLYDFEENDKLNFSQNKFNFSERYLNTCSQYFSYVNSDENEIFEESENTFLNNTVQEIVQSFPDNLELCLRYFDNIANFYGVEDDTISQQISKQIVVTLFRLILNNNNTAHSWLTAYYNSLLFSLNKASCFSSSVIVSKTKKIIDNLHKLKIPMIENFSKYLVYFIPNKEFEFDFSLISNLLSKGMSITSVERMKISYFVQMFLDKICAVASKEKIESILNSDSNFSNLSSMLPYETAKWKYHPNEHHFSESEILIDHIKNKKEFSSLEILYSVSKADFTYLFSSCLFYAKVKTLSHLRETLNLYSNDLKTLVNSKERELNVLQALFDIWSSSSVHLKFITEILLNKGIVRHENLIDFIFSELKESAVIRCSYFNLVELSLSNGSTNIRRIRTALEKEKEKLARSEESSSAEILTKIENLEREIEDLSSWNEMKEFYILNRFVQLYLSLSEDSIIRLPLLERISNHLVAFKWELMKNSNKIESLKGRNSSLDSLLNTINI